METEILDVTKLRYALYVRKSTDDSEKQTRSIDDQIAECRQMAARLHLRIVTQFDSEKKSAKRPGRRPIFRQLLRGIQAGTYDGIIAWHPDRLARNMMDGGEIIHMLDEGVIKDLKFVSHHFTNDPGGKMLLSIIFAMSKHFSDNLSQNVTRGVRRSLAEGKALNSKPGYVRSKHGFQVPDKKNFPLLVEAWKQRCNGVSLEAIASSMNKHGYGRKIGSTGKRVRMDKRLLSEIFKDPFYYGILVQAGQKVDLRQIYNFEPATTEEDYFAIQTLADKRSKPYKQRRTAYYPFKMMVLCSFCGQRMYAGAAKGHTKRYLFYRCDKDTCPRQKKSIRGKVILEFIYDFFKSGLHLTEKDYRDYYDGMTYITKSRHEKLLIDLHSQQARLKVISSELVERSLKILELERASAARRINEQRINALEAQGQALEESIEDIKKQLPDIEAEKLSLEQFLNLVKNAETTVKSASSVVKDKICRYVFLNFVVDEEKVVSYHLKPPFDIMLKTHSVVFGAPKATKLELFTELAEAISKHWNPNDFDETLLDISESPTQQEEFIY
jgi:site-specific DNA recombinase